MQDAKNYMRESTNSLLKFDIRFRILFKGFFFFFLKKTPLIPSFAKVNIECSSQFSQMIF